MRELNEAESIIAILMGTFMPSALVQPHEVVPGDGVSLCR